MDRRRFIRTASPVATSAVLLATTDFYKMSVDCDVSIHGVEWGYSQVLNAGFDPDVLFCSTINYHDAQRAVSKCEGKVKFLAVIAIYDMPPDAWCIGNLNAPDHFYGSPGA